MFNPFNLSFQYFMLRFFVVDAGEGGMMLLFHGVLMFYSILSVLLFYGVSICFTPFYLYFCFMVF